MIGFKPGRITLTTTSSPLFSCAAWTWAIEAEASGVLEKELNTSGQWKRLLNGLTVLRELLHLIIDSHERGELGEQ